MALPTIARGSQESHSPERETSRVLANAVREPGSQCEPLNAGPARRIGGASAREAGRTGRWVATLRSRYGAELTIGKTQKGEPNRPSTGALWCSQTSARSTTTPSWGDVVVPPVCGPEAG